MEDKQATDGINVISATVSIATIVFTKKKEDAKCVIDVTHQKGVHVKLCRTPDPPKKCFSTRWMAAFYKGNKMHAIYYFLFIFVEELCAADVACIPSSLEETIENTASPATFESKTNELKIDLSAWISPKD